jgi:histone-lysine N-methyltransferase SUV420H
LEQVEAGSAVLVGHSTLAQHPAVLDEPSALAIETLVVNNTEAPVTPPKAEEGCSKRKRRQSRPIIDKDHAPAVRHPSDYVLTARLLAEPATSWIRCKICEGPFVQKDSYFTRSSCPRCERHSKLYGYQWPKTDVEDSEDDEERVLDHRTVHRFIKPAEEKKVRKLARESTGSRAVTREVSEIAKESIEEVNAKRNARMSTKRSRLTM